MIGHGVPVYRGYSSQYGHGLGNVLGGIVRTAIPIVGSMLKSAGKEILMSGVKRLKRKIQGGESSDPFRHKENQGA
jgi:hypothetical protein